ncbi:dolichol-phosphate mannosyltransferase [Verrucomicrobium sp. GAS474]|uniref:glycosyltransferase n=1 Tax=Verrucomicrobium sp. GAS474 TaxID=1882831 RepID=UPI00087CB966|nr:glycosyltransferase [Verrucomicrobium sp. GAS474]SDU14117.1 dolichol-phosphate mannosyltransferase [Verrucomicrobium sp. GAS474]
MSQAVAPALSVVIPAYEEAENLRGMLPALHQTLGGLGISYEIVIIDAHEKRDDTAEVCTANGARHYYGEGKSSYGGAIQQGIRLSLGERVVIMDADGSHNPSFIATLWADRDRADLLIASRYVPGGHTDNPKILIWMSLFVNIVFRIVLGLRVADVSNSFRLYRGADLRALRLECVHFDIVEEILVKLSIYHPAYRIKEIPFFFEQRNAGKTKRDLVAFAISYVTTLRQLWKLKHAASRDLKATK